MQRVLVLCTGNSCRSILAEALINESCEGDYVAESAGSRPTGKVHPGALATLQRHDITHHNPRSKSWDEFAGQQFDLVITVCDQAANETCPLFAGSPRSLHWSIEDPALVTGDAAEIERAFENTFQALQQRIRKEL